MSKKEPKAYIAKCKCGGIIMATLDDGRHNPDVAKDVAECIRAGFVIERVTGNVVRKSKWCECKTGGRNEN